MRHPATKGRADSNQKAIADAIRLLGYPVMDLHTAGNGVEDLLVGLQVRRALSNSEQRFIWLPVEAKVPPIRYTPAQVEWRWKTEAWPRITVTSAQDAVDQISQLTR